MQKQALGKGLGALIPDLSALDDKEKKALGIHAICSCWRTMCGTATSIRRPRFTVVGRRFSAIP